MSAKVAVFIITCDGMPVLRRTVESMCAKAGHDFDFYVMLNGSTDHSDYYLKHLAPRKPRLVIEKENKGLPISYNRIIAEIKAGKEYDFIVFVEDDCYFETENWLKNLLDAYEKMVNGEMIVLCPFRIGYMWANNIGDITVRNNYMGETQTKTHCYAACRISPPTTCMMAPAGIFDLFSFDEGKPMHSGDKDFGEWCNANGIRMYYVLDVVVRHLEDERIREKPKFDRFIKAHIPYGI